MRRYINKKAVWHGLEFDSRAELDRFICLQCRRARGEIGRVHRQMRFEVLAPQYYYVEKKLRKSVKYERRTLVKALHYTADFVYSDYEAGCIVIEDVKSAFTLKERDWPLRRALIVRKVLDHNTYLPGTRLPWMFRECIVDKDAFREVNYGSGREHLHWPLINDHIKIIK